MKTLERRLKLLKKEAEGISPAKIVKELAKEFSCSKRAVYTDFEKRVEWQPQLQHLQNQRNLALKILNRYEQIYALAYNKFSTCKNESVQVAYLKLMMKLNARIFDTGVFPNLLARLEEVEKVAMGWMKSNKSL